MNKNYEQIKLKDHSRFYRWIQNLEEKDKSLTPRSRKSKWVIILTFAFVFFVLSFVFFPAVRINSDSLEAPTNEIEPVNKETKAPSVFELPVDSFNNHLKTLINAELSEKK